MTDTNDNGLGYAAWPCGVWERSWEWGRVTHRTEKTAAVQEWWEWAGGRFSDRARRKNFADGVILFDDAADARALVQAIADLNRREDDTARQYREKRRALVAAARAKQEARGE